MTFRFHNLVHSLPWQNNLKGVSARKRNMKSLHKSKSKGKHRSSRPGAAAALVSPAHPLPVRACTGNIIYEKYSAHTGSVGKESLLCLSKRAVVFGRQLVAILALRRDTKLDAGRQAKTHVIHHLDLICRQGRSVARRHVVTHLHGQIGKHPASVKSRSRSRSR
jgi:hypothetical protein